MTALIVFVLLQVADVVTTLYGLERGKKEGNPAIRWLIEKLGGAWPVVKVAVLSGVGVWLWATGQIAILWGLNAVMLAVVGWNVKVIRG